MKPTALIGFSCAYRLNFLVLIWEYGNRSPNRIYSHIPYEEPVGYGEIIPKPTFTAFSVAGVGQVSYIYDQPPPHTWVVVMEFRLSYYIGETLLFTIYIYIHHGNLK